MIDIYAWFALIIFIGMAIIDYRATKARIKHLEGSVSILQDREFDRVRSK